jgi:ATP-dependent RNA helicase DDX5/DBP2
MLHSNIIQDIAHHKYETPTPIQSQGIPIALSGRDILGCAETGSGKTASFAIPMIHHCLQQKPLRPGDGPMGLVLAPTRELAQQVRAFVHAWLLVCI